MQYATFINFTDKPFTAYWNGRPYTFKPGQKREHLNSAIAENFAKHLANQVLTEAGKEQYCSPKKPNEVPQFMEVFRKAFFLEGDGTEVDPETGLASDGQANDLGSMDQAGMNVKVIPRKPIGTADPYDAHSAPQFGPGSKPQVIGDASSDTDDEENFEGNQEGDGSEA